MGTVCILVIQPAKHGICCFRSYANWSSPRCREFKDRLFERWSRL